MHPTEVIKFPMISEKVYRRLARTVYTFKVHPRANKYQIKVAFSTIFKVKVARVWTINRKQKPKRVGQYQGYRARSKTAIIKLKPGFRLDFLHEEPEPQKSPPKAQPLKLGHGD